VLHVLIEGCPGAYYSYGKVAKYIGEGLIENGFDVSYICGDSEYEVSIDKYKKTNIYPNTILPMFNKFLANTYSYYINKLNIDYIIAIGGPWADPLKSEMASFNEERKINSNLRKTKLIGYFSFDWFLAPQLIKNQFLYPHVVALPTDAERKYASIPIDRFVKVPHGVNSNIFNIDVEKKNVEIPTKPDIILGSIMKNHGRKNWGVASFVASALNTWGIKTAFLPLTTYVGGSQNWWNLDYIMQGTSDFFPIIYGNAYMQMPILRPGNSIELGFGFNEKEQASVSKLMDIHILPTRGEGFSLAVLETLALGIPNIVSENEVLREVYDSFKSVIFVPNSNLWMWNTEGTFFYDPSYINFVETTIDIAENIEEYKEIAYKESKLVSKKYSWENTTKQIIKAIELSDKFDTTMIEELDYMSGGGKRW
jgi:glycosyltransferase involved in cell wall biosynthesis